MRAWPHEWLLNRPKTKDSLLSRRRWDVQGPSGSHLLREPLLGQTLRQQGQKGRIAGPQEEARIYSEARREGKEPPWRRSRRTALPHTLQERCDYVEGITGLSVSRSTMCRAIARIGS